jgi:thiamine transporter ThiT
MSKRTGLAIVLVTGIVWGLCEIFVGDVFYKFHMPFRSGSLTAVGMAILIISRMVYDRPGASLGAGVVAGIIRCLVPKVYLCHLVAISLEGCTFDVIWSALRAGERQTLRRAWVAGAVAVYSGFIAFGAASIYLFKFQKWTAMGMRGVGVWTLKSGTFGVALFIVLAPLALMAGRRLAARTTRLAASRAASRLP